MKPLAWGILGTGNIARQFAGGIACAHASRCVAVGSRTLESAAAFASKYSLAAHGSYDALLADRNVEAVYISLPNTMHHEWTLKALAAGKHVLCEKPFAVNVSEAREMFDVARSRGLLLVEAFMYRSHPQTLAVYDAVKSGAIGRVRMIRTSFCFRVMKTEGNIRFSPALAGGVLMDVGCYCTNFARYFAGEEPSSVHGAARIHSSGVDEIVVGTMSFPSGILASFTCGMSVHADNSAYICGDEGYIEAPVPWKPPVKGAQFTIARQIPPRMDGNAPVVPPRQTISVDAPSELYGLEADDFAASVREGRPPRITEADTIGNMRVIEMLRAQNDRN